MSTASKVKEASDRRSSPRLSAIKAAALKKQREGGRNMSSNVDIVNDPYGAANWARDNIRKSTGFVFDPMMAEHFNPWDSNHVEKPARLLDSYSRCQELGLVDRCHKIETRFASDEELTMVHSAQHLEDLKELVTLAATPETLNDAKLKCITKYQGVYVNEKTLDCTRMAAAAAIDLVEGIIKGDLTNGIALVRPPGHHAMTAEFNGFCLCNNVAVAAKNAIDNFGIKRVLIVDFDAHHGQATQRIFYDSSKVLYISIHRYEQGAFWPNLRESNFDAIGKKDSKGRGFNVNVPLNEIGCGDSEYLAIFQQIILPMAYEYSPELVLVSAGFDAAFGCPEGCMKIMPATYGHIINSLMALSHGKVAVVLEGGYFVPTVAEGVAMCLRALLGDYCLRIGKLPEPKPSVVDTILNVLTVLKPFWKFLRMQDEFDSEMSSDMLHRPVIEFRGDEVEKDNQAETKIYDPKFHYAMHSPEKYADLMFQFKEIQSGYARNLLEHGMRENKLALVYDELMMRHMNTEEPGHPEQPARVQRIFDCLQDFGILERKGVVLLPSRRAIEEEVLLVHDEAHLQFMKSIPSKSQQELNKLAERLDSIYINPDTLDCALLSAGSLLAVVDSVCQNESQKGLAVIRPPGHHAEADEANGFCMLNNVAMAAKYALETHDVQRILILDWDVHHGNGIQNTFYSDPRVLYISLHRYDNGTFFPAKPDANFDFVGNAAGEGFNVNVPWNAPGMGDSEYAMAFFNVVLPIAYQFDPDLVLISAGFDAAIGDPLGKCKVSPEMYGHMTHHLQALANGKIIVALEGGYNLNSISFAMTMCAKALIGDPIHPITAKEPKTSAKESVKSVIRQHSRYWSCLKFSLHLPNRISLSDYPEILPESVTAEEEEIDGVKDSPYIPSQYGTPSNTHGICTVTSSHHFSSNDRVCDTADYVRRPSATDAIAIRMAGMGLAGGEVAASWPPAVSEFSSGPRTDYLPPQIGASSPASHIYTFSTASNEVASPMISTDSAKKTEE